MEIDLSRLPKEFIERLRKIVPAEKQPVVFASLAKRKATTFRANTLKISPDELETKLRESGLNLQRYRRIANAFILIGNSTLRQLTETTLYKEGFFYVQSFSSMLPPLILGPQPNETVLDLTAAPGSKTTQLASLMGNEGKITALEINQRRVYKLLANLKAQGVTNTQVERSDARFFWRTHSGEFDCVLLDAPCTTEGQFNFNDESSFFHWSSKLIKRMSFLQRSLIFSAVNCLKTGGLLVYSTCTFSPEENEAVVNFALEKFKGKILVEKIDLDLPVISPGLNHFGNLGFDRSLRNCVRVLPDEKFEAFFLAKIRRVG